MSIFVHVFLWTYVFNIWLFGKEFYCWKPVEKQPNSPAEQLNFCIFLSATCERSNFFSQSAELVIVHPSEYSHPTWEWMPHCGLGLHCPVTNDIDHFFTWSLVNCVPSLETSLFKFFIYLLKLLSKVIKRNLLHIALFLLYLLINVFQGIFIARCTSSYRFLKATQTPI